MSLAPGVRLGPYEIIAPLGAGGMREVFRARDTKLNREAQLLDPGELGTRVFTVDIERGERRLVREIEPRDPVGVSGVDHVVITRDGQSYAYSYQQFFSDLFLVEGLR